MHDSTNTRALDIITFCHRYGVGRSTAYKEIKAARLPIFKVGRRTLISVDAAEAWLKSMQSASGKNLINQQ